MAEAKRTTLVNPQGDLVTVPEEQASYALRQGFKAPSDADLAEESKREKYGQGLGTELRAGAEGAARGLTFGLSDYALQALGADKEGLAERKARNPLSAMGGETLGVGAGLLASGGLGGALGAGVRGASAAGELAGQGVARGLGALGLGGAEGLAGRALAAGAEKGIAGATEGALYGAGQGISETALGDPTDAAQTILAHAGMGAILGGGLGAATGVLGGVGKAALESLRADGTDAATGAAAIASGSPKTAGWHVKGAAKITSILSGADEGVLTDMLDLNSAEGAKVRAAAFADQGVDNAAVRNLTSHVQSVEDNSRILLDEARGAAKDAHIAKVIKRSNVDEQEQAAMETLASMQQRIDTLREDPEYGYKPGVKRLQQQLDIAAHHVENAYKSDNPSAKMFAAFDDLKAELGKITEPKRGVSYNTQDQAAFTMMEDMYKAPGGLMQFLEDRGLWGKAAEIQERVNRKWVPALEKRRQFRSQFLREFGNKDWQSIYRADPAAISSLLKGAGVADQDLNYELLNQHVDALGDLSREIQDAYQLGGEHATATSNITAATKAAKEQISDAMKTAAIRNEARKILETKGGRAAAQLAKLEVRFRMGINPADAAVQNEVARNVQLGNMQRAMRDVYSQVDKGADGLLSKLKEIPKVTTPTAVKAYHEIRWAPRERGDEQANKENPYDKRLSELANLSANPELLRQRLESSMGDLHGYVPRIATEMHLAATQAVNYVYNLAPKNPYMDATVDMRRLWRPSTIELQSFERTLQAVHDPLGVIRDFQHGHVSPEAADALRTVYPHLYARLVQRLVPKIAEQEGIPLQRRLELADVLGVPIDSLTSDDTMASFQDMYANPPQRPAPPARTSVSKNLRAKQSMTPIQRILEET